MFYGVVSHLVLLVFNIFMSSLTAILHYAALRVLNADDNEKFIFCAVNDCKAINTWQSVVLRSRICLRSLCSREQSCFK